MTIYFSFQNDWRSADATAGVIRAVDIGIDYWRGHTYFFGAVLFGVGFRVGWYTPKFIADQYAADDVPHPFADPDALTGNVTSPIGAHSFEAIKEVHEDSPQAMNWVDQSRDGS